MITSTTYVEDLLMEIQDAYLDTPELELTLSEARRQFGIDSQTCRGLLGCARRYAACSCALTRAVTSGSSQGWPAQPIDPQ